MAAIESPGGGGFCIQFGPATLAVAAEAVEGFVDAARLVALPLSPAGLVGLFPYRGGLVPLIAPAPPSPEAAPERTIVLILRTGHGLIGLRVARGVTEVRPGCAMGPPPDGAAPTLPEGMVPAGALDRDGVVLPVLDPDRTWLALRRRVEVTYGEGQRQAPRAAVPARAENGAR